jgi:hypothetical protein
VIKSRYIQWPQMWNRPLSKEEIDISKRLDVAPDQGHTRVAQTPQSWHSALHQERKAETVEEA